MLFATMRRSSLGAAPKEPTPICMKKWEPDTFKSSSTGKGHLIRGCLLVTVVELSQKVWIRSLLAIKIFIYLDNKYPGHCWKFNWHLRYSSPKAMSSNSNSRGVYSPDLLMNKTLASTIMLANVVFLAWSQWFIWNSSCSSLSVSLAWNAPPPLQAVK